MAAMRLDSLRWQQMLLALGSMVIVLLFLGGVVLSWFMPEEAAVAVMVHSSPCESDCYIADDNNLQRRKLLIAPPTNSRMVALLPPPLRAIEDPPQSSEFRGGDGTKSRVQLGVSLGVVFAFFMLLKLALLIWLLQRRHHRKQLARQAALQQAPDGALAGGDWEIDMSDIKVIQDCNGEDVVLGKGSFGQVLKGIKGDVQPVAIKSMLRTCDKRLEEAFICEIAMLKYVSRNRNIVQFYGACVQSNSLLLVVELMEGGDLRSALSRDMEGRLSWYGQGKSVAIDIARGLAYLHSCRVMHRDLKSCNVLLTKDATAKISDVGMAQITNEGGVTRDGAVGTFAWAAPEMLLGERCTEKVDIYSLGVVLWEIVTGRMPQRGAVDEPQVPEECPAEVTAVIAACLQREPGSRPSAHEVCRMLYKAPPAWTEPQDVRMLLDEPTPQISEGEDLLNSMLVKEDSAEMLISHHPSKLLAENSQLKDVIQSIHAKLDATRGENNRTQRTPSTTSTPPVQSTSGGTPTSGANGSPSTSSGSRFTLPLLLAKLFGSSGSQPQSMTIDDLAQAEEGHAPAAFLPTVRTGRRGMARPPTEPANTPCVTIEVAATGKAASTTATHAEADASSSADQ